MAPEVKDREKYELKSDISGLALIGTEIFKEVCPKNFKRHKCFSKRGFNTDSNHVPTIPKKIKI